MPRTVEYRARMICLFMRSFGNPKNFVETGVLGHGIKKRKDENERARGRKSERKRLGKKRSERPGTREREREKERA